MQIAKQEPNNSNYLVFWADGHWSRWNEFDKPWLNLCFKAKTINTINTKKYIKFLIFLISNRTCKPVIFTMSAVEKEISGLGQVPGTYPALLKPVYSQVWVGMAPVWHSEKMVSLPHQAGLVQIVQDLSISLVTQTGYFLFPWNRTPEPGHFQHKRRLDIVLIKVGWSVK